MSRDDAFLLDMLIAARRVREFSGGMNWQDFQKDDRTQNAVMHAIQTIGEAARRVSEEFRAAHPDIPWGDIIGMRHRLVHDYMRIIAERVWAVVAHDIAPLIARLESLVPPPPPGDPEPEP